MLLMEAAYRKTCACEGSLACSTCHVIVMDMDYYNKLQDPTDEEMTCWILLLGLQRRKFWSHLGCQIVARPELDGICLALPAASRNFAVDGFVPKPR
ncbi:adrenodoxin-like protein 1, mitochondrial isoform X4 [Citrus sinensis]|uniref:adrenodoxin-like protein 1, mitochondrial isoform X4 n=1 Tax=Citrus sinensis TaxID=2711 RepID=UPI002277A719|nr:adrenodoxin-like protein 1, mitochondrial isoform X4 [Citrus sinensis]XP_052289685.1 adrenodoxin-like protein 1, mitochondrial isoform X4 [Citrus sinensis]